MDNMLQSMKRIGKYNGNQGHQYGNSEMSQAKRDQHLQGCNGKGRLVFFSKTKNQAVDPVNWGALLQRKTPCPGDQCSRQIKLEKIS